MGNIKHGSKLPFYHETFHYAQIYHLCDLNGFCAGSDIVMMTDTSFQTNLQQVTQYIETYTTQGFSKYIVQS